jgi:hypothetical protein
MNDDTRPARLRAVEGEHEHDQVPRLLRFREAHPDVKVEYRPPAWQAIIPQPNGETVITRYNLKAILDKLDELLGEYPSS